jgi:hypothetical protein
MELDHNLKTLNKIGSVVALGLHVSNIFGIVKIAKGHSNGDDTSVRKP